MLMFVEGSMERQFVNANFKYVHAIPIQNGITWSVDQLCKQIVNNYLAFDYFGDIFVWLDREGRAETCDEIKAHIRSSLTDVGADPLRIYILVNDRMTENTILADEAVIMAEFGLGNYEYNHEGRNGKSRLKDLYRDIDVNYKEMVHGTKLLKKIRLRNASLKSPSVSSFFEDCDIDCWWF